MTVGVLTLELAILEARSLKDKRRVIKSLVDRLRNRFNASVAEVGYGDLPKRARLGVATVSNDSRLVHSMLDKMVDVARRSPGVTLVDYQRELL